MAKVDELMLRMLAIISVAAITTLNIVAATLLDKENRKNIFEISEGLRADVDEISKEVESL